MVSRSEQEVAKIGRIDAVPKILEVIRASTGMRFAAVARVTATNWVACSLSDEVFGMQPGSELDVATTLCDTVRGEDATVVMDDAASDPHYRDHPVPALYGFRSYISAPIRRPDGSFFGTLCALDPEPLRIDDPKIVGMFELFADLIGAHLDIQDRLDRSEEALSTAHRTEVLREQFIAVLGHDLRNPLAAIDAGSRLLGQRALDRRGREMVELIQRSVLRMSGLIEDVVDFAKGRLGGGLSVDRDAGGCLAAALEQVVAELRAARPDSRIEAHVDLRARVRCDPARIAQVASNLLANALQHGAADRPVVLSARGDDGGLELFVENRGAAIPEATLGQLFEPFFRARVEPGGGGLGLGLYIASEIARAHGGRLEVASTAEATRFTLRIPG